MNQPIHEKSGTVAKELKGGAKTKEPKPQPLASQDQSHRQGTRTCAAKKAPKTSPTATPAPKPKRKAPPKKQPSQCRPFFWRRPIPATPPADRPALCFGARAPPAIWAERKPPVNCRKPTHKQLLLPPDPHVFAACCGSLPAAKPMIHRA